jgi:hypothetical protein
MGVEKTRLSEVVGERNFSLTRSPLKTVNGAHIENFIPIHQVLQFSAFKLPPKRVFKKRCKWQ